MQVLEGVPDRQAGDNDRLELLRVIDQLFNTISFYPEGHTRSIDVTQKFRKALSPVIGHAPALFVDYGAHGLRLQHAPVEYRDGAGQRLVQLLDTLGIAHMEIPVDASVADLQLLVRELLAAKLAAETSAGFTQFQFDSLPECMKIQQRRFGSRIAEDLHPDQVGETLSSVVDEVLHDLDSATGEHAVPAAVRQMAESLLGRIVEQSADTLPVNGDEAAGSLADVLDLSAHAVRHALPELMSNDGPQRIKQALAQAERALAGVADPELARWIVSIFERVLQTTEDQDKSTKNQGEEPTYKWSLGELKDRIGALPQVMPLPSTESSATQHEALAVYLHVLTGKSEPRYQDLAADRIADILRADTTPQSRQVLVSTLKILLADADRTVADHILPKLMPALRQNEDFGLGEVWNQVAEDLSDDGLAVAWPHLVAEIVRDRRHERIDDLGPLYRLVKRLPVEQTRAEAERCERTHTFVAGAFDKRFFQFPKPEIYPLVVALLDTDQGGRIGKWLHDAMCNYPPSPLAAVVGRALGRYRSVQRDFVREIFLAGEDPWPLSLRREATALLSEVLVQSDADGRQRDWIPDAIEALGELGVAESETVLNRIVSDRKWLVVPVWPQPCRSAAQAALAKLQTRSPRK